MPRHRNVTRLEEISLSSIVQSCSLACTRLEQEDGLSGTAVEDPANTPDIAPVSSNSQVSLVCVITLYRLYKLLNWESLNHITIFNFDRPPSCGMSLSYLQEHWKHFYHKPLS